LQVFTLHDILSHPAIPDPFNSDATTINLDFIQPGRSWTLHEGQISSVVLGINNRVWTNYCFVNVLHDESLDCTNEDSLDPCAAGQLFSVNPNRDPRDYWLLVCNFRIQEATRYWRALVTLFSRWDRRHGKVRLPNGAS
jgi:hypothetical protein